MNVGIKQLENLWGETGITLIKLVMSNVLNSDECDS